MRTLRSLDYIRDTNLVLFPDGTIKNQTDTEEGTPVTREVYGDIITNIYALLRETGIVPNNTEDNETNGYQILSAFKRLANELNDIEQLLTIAGSTITVGFDIDNLPDKYVFIGRASEAYNDALNYTFSGSGSNSYTFSSRNNFASGDEVLVVIDQSGVRAVGLGGQSQENGVFTIFGIPLMFNDSAQMYYEEDGKLFTDIPSQSDLQSLIRIAEGNGTLYVYNSMVMQGHVLCFCWISDIQTYKFYQFDINDLSTAQAVTVEEITIPSGSNNEPYVFTDGTVVYLTNQAGTTVNDNELAGLTYNPVARTLNLDFNRVLNANFNKTTNGAIIGNDLVTFIGGELKKYSLTTGAEQDLGTYNGFVGNLFVFNGELYYSNGELAKNWMV